MLKHGLWISFVLLLGGSAWACATVSREHISIAAEQALIVWDAENSTQHFVRRAEFRSAGRSAGFLVPTPSVPTLAEVPDAIFDGLKETIKPAVRTKLEIDFLIFTAMSGSVSGMSELGLLNVVHRQSVAGYDAAILQASDPQALADWLKKEHFAETPELRDWLKPFVERGWIITAFKLEGENPSTDAIHMSFKTDRPFYPYSQPKKSPVLRPFLLHLMANSPLKGQVGDSVSSLVLRYAGRVDTREIKGAADLSFLPQETYLTSFYEEYAPLRHAGEEMYFSANPEQGDFRMEVYDVVGIVIPGELILGFMMLILVVRGIRIVLFGVPGPKAAALSAGGFAPEATPPKAAHRKPKEPAASAAANAMPGAASSAEVKTS